MKSFLSDLYEKYQKQELQNQLVADDLLELNYQRLSVVGYVAASANILSIFLFWNNIAETPKEVIWRNGVILSHIITLIFMIGLVLVTRYLPPSKRTPKAMRAVQWLSLVILLLSGVVLVTLDQLVTTNVTPFLVICTIAAVIYLLKPIHAVLVYAVVFAGYAWALGITQTDQAILLSNRVNGISATGIAITLSVILWRVAAITKLQERKLLLQNIELEERKSLLEQYAFFDKLTGLFNRHIFYEMIEKEEARLQRERTQAVLLLLDIDHFKRVNDLYGHPAGDKVLAAIGGILGNRLRKGDIISRWGGEEFLCCLTNTKLSKVHFVANSLKDAIAEAKFEQISNEIAVTVSIGMSIMDPVQDIDFEKAYQNADKALYAAKSGGRNRIEICPGLENLLSD